MIVVAGPRIDPASLPSHPGLEVVPYVHNLYRHLAACDLAVVQGGLTTAMELTAQKRPFLYFPLRHHFEQNFHVRHRLERYGAGAAWTSTTPRRSRSPRRSPRRSTARSTTATSRPTAPRVRRGASPSCCRRSRRRRRSRAGECDTPTSTNSREPGVWCVTLGLLRARPAGLNSRPPGPQPDQPCRSRRGDASAVRPAALTESDRVL